MMTKIDVGVFGGGGGGKRPNYNVVDILAYLFAFWSMLVLYPNATIISNILILVFLGLFYAVICIRVGG